MKRMTFLTNPPRRSRRASTARSSARNRGAGTQRRKHRRPPPAGWASWSEYMASIRPGAKRTAATPHSRGSNMSSKKKGRRSSGRHRRTGSSSSGRRYRHNPPRGFRNIVPFAKDAVMGAGGVLAGKIAARKGRGLLGQKPGTVLGSVIEAGIGIVAGLGVSQVSPKYGALVAIGGVLSPMETLVQQLGIPHVSDSLADDGFLFGGDSGVEMVSAVPDDAGQLSEFVNNADTAARQATLAEFVQNAA